MRIHVDRRSCRANTAVDKFASVKRYGRRRTTVSRHWEAIKTLNSHFRPGKKVVLERQPKGEKIGVNGTRNASREYIKSAWITRKWTDRDPRHGSLWWKHLAIMRVRCARGTSCRYINAARVPVYSSSYQEGATNHKRWYTVDRLLFMSAVVMKHPTHMSRSKVPISLSFHDYIFVSGDLIRNGNYLMATLVPIVSISLE